MPLDRPLARGAPGHALRWPPGRCRTSSGLPLPGTQSPPSRFDYHGPVCYLRPQHFRSRRRKWVRSGPLFHFRKPGVGPEAGAVEMGRKEEILDKVRQIAAPLAAQEGLELIDAEIGGGGGPEIPWAFIPQGRRGRPGRLPRRAPPAPPPPPL